MWSEYLTTAAAAWLAAGVALASEADGLSLGVVVGFVALVESIVLVCLLFVAKSGEQEVQVVMGRYVLGIDGKGLFELRDGLAP